MVLLSIFTFQTSLTILLLVLLSGDVELNPGPEETESCIFILHCNIRSIRNKLEYIRDCFLDFEILCFTGTHLDRIVLTSSLNIDDRFDNPYRKDRTSHGGVILVFISNHLIYKRRPDLEIYCEESI